MNERYLLGSSSKTMTSKIILPKKQALFLKVVVTNF